MRTQTSVHLEPCKGCKSRGTLGVMAGHRIICEMCWFSGWVWTERCSMVQEDV